MRGSDKKEQLGMLTPSEIRYFLLNSYKTNICYSYNYPFFVFI